MSQKAVTIAAFALAVGAGLYAVYERNQNLTLRAQVLSSEPPTVLSADGNPGSPHKPELLTTAPALSNEQLNELLRLRAEHLEARKKTDEIEKLREENRKLQAARALAGNSQNGSAEEARRPVVSRDSWAFLGFATPEDAFQSATWAMSQGDLPAMLKSLTPESQQKTAKEWEGKPEAELATQNINSMTNVTGYQILGRIAVSEDEVHLLVHTEGEDLRTTFIMRKISNEWKLADRAKYQSF